MKVTEILIEAIEPKREHFHDILVANKEQLQKSRTRLGVIKNLQRMFPGVKFKLTGDRRQAANYNADTKEITINNSDKLMTGRNVRQNWDKFLKVMVDLLTHETIHSEQSKRRDYWYPKTPKETATKAQRSDYQQRWMNLNDMLDSYLVSGTDEDAEKVRKQIKNLVAKARRRGVKLQTSHQDYLRDRDEITAYAEGIANDLVDYHSGDRKAAIDELRRGAPTHSHIFNNYAKALKKNDKALQELIKQTVRYIERN